MARTEPFEKHPRRYEAWFERNPHAWHSEVETLRMVQEQPPRRGLEIGVGTGRFALPLGFGYGLEPARPMIEHARQAGITVVRGIAERLPFAPQTFDQVLLVTTICFVDDLEASFREARRVLASGGQLLIGLVDRESPVGQHYLRHQAESVFYREATFYSTDQVLDLLAAAGFGAFRLAQTIFGMPAEMTAPDPVREGYGKGSFVAIRAQ